MSGWQKCDTCRKVRTGEEFDAGATTCRACLTAPVPAVRKRTTAVTTSRTAPRAVPRASPVTDAPGPRRPLLGSVGSGDLEVRERRARRAAQEALTESHPDEFRILLRDARQAEGLRPSDTSASGPVGAGGDGSGSVAPVAPEGPADGAPPPGAG